MLLSLTKSSSRSPSRSMCRVSMSSFSFSFSSSNLLFSSVNQSFSAFPASSALVWKITQLSFQLFFFHFFNPPEQKARCSSCVANMSTIQRQSYRTTFCLLPFPHWIIKRGETKRQTLAQRSLFSTLFICPEKKRLYIIYKDYNSWGHFYWQG